MKGMGQKLMRVWHTRQQEIVKESQSINSMQGSSGLSLVFPEIRNLRRAPGRKRGGWVRVGRRAVRSFRRRSRGRALESGGTKNMNMKGTAVHSTGSPEPAAAVSVRGPAAHASSPGAARRHPPPE
ncbi:hypothetical protein EMIT0158MI4_90329 [Burkholderia ambifaria]